MTRTVSWMLALGLAVGCCGAPRFTWQRFEMDGSRTGVGIPTADNVSEAIGTVEDGVYTAPNGRVFRDGATPLVAEKLIAVQPDMRRLKEVIGQSARYMDKPDDCVEFGLGNLIADAMLATCQELTGKKADVSLQNFGGIRVDMPEGAITLDVVESMLPFRNYLTIVDVKGADLRKIFAQFAGTPLCVGGARLVLEGGALADVTVGGAPLQDQKTYAVVTTSFLLDGGDGYAIAKDAVRMNEYPVLMKEMFERYIRSMTAENKVVDAEVDGRVTKR
ncbi:MAG: 5'-nucleotidase C-terminal domain-containing protein [Bacteroidales bacterium]|nr:5'-nucleotidase C-terminal domain-containing protein [Bacteroidales bacterium]